ncbi:MULTISPECIES: S-layer protein [Lactobacillaceae]|uniref:S-layer protein n=1 Tax=Lactobacillaceae TaxID=33958 RepID=UPI0014568672|nr:S-layer protein [Lactobacillus sp. HBUAS51381]NLR09545.1 S-layer protein [Lactobacillus sp. HBUAS51381]
MQSSLKNSLYLGLAVLSLGAVATVNTTASAASKVKVTSDVALKTAGETRNVEATGTNALYSKPGTVKGAKRVASKSTMKKMANSKKSADYFRAYRVAKTNKGLVYYKVVSMNGKYRGYIYGGRSTTTFARGIQSADTTQTAAMPAKTTGYHLANAKKNGLWTAPKNTQYKAKSVSLYGAGSKDTFTVSKAQTKTREGSLYYYVTDDQDNSIAGWIYAGKGYKADATTQSLGGLALKASDAKATADNSVTINYVGSNGNSVGTSTFVTATKNTKQNNPVQLTDKNMAGQTVTDFINDATNTPAGYKVSDTAVATKAAKAVYGGTVTISVYKAATSTIAFYLPSANGVLAGNQLNPNDFSKGKPAITAAQAAELTGNSNDAIVTTANGKTQTVTDSFFTKPLYSKLLKATSNMTFANTADSSKSTTIKSGESYYITYTYSADKTARANSNAKYGDTILAVFDQQATVATALPDATNSGVTNY